MMKRAIPAICLALLSITALPAGAHGPETVTPLFKRALPNVPGKALIAVEADGKSDHRRWYIENRDSWRCFLTTRWFILLP